MDGVVIHLTRVAKRCEEMHQEMLGLDLESAEYQVYMYIFMYYFICVVEFGG